MRIVITGAAGLLGSHLVRELDDRHELVPVDREAVDHPSARCFPLSDLDALTGACEGAGALCHLGANGAVDAPWHDVLESNVIGTYHAFEAARRAGVERVIFASTNHVVGGYEAELAPAIYRGALLVDHRAEPRPDSLYGASKLWGEGLGRLYSDRDGMRVLCIRIGAAVPGDWRAVARDAMPGRVGALSEAERIEGAAAMWLSLADLTQLVERGLSADYRFACVYGVSGNRTRFFDLEHARQVLGYVPQDASA